jgi:hypothetical protein
MGASCAVEADGGEFYFGLGTDERERRRVSEWGDTSILTDARVKSLSRLQRWNIFS